jgi:exonuclease SbcC
MRLISLELREWRAYEQCPIEFPDGLVGVGGPNGAGKTTIAEAVGWTLFGKLRPGATVGDLRRQGGAGRPTAELVFQLGDTVYTVRRVAGGECLLWIGDRQGEPEASGARNVSQRIAQELDLTWDVFKRTVFAEQKDIAALDPKATGPARRAHVERLLGLTRFKRAAEQARGAVKEIQNEITGRTAELEDPDELQAALTNAEKDAEEQSPRVAELKDTLASANTEYRAARAAVEQEHERTKSAALLQDRLDTAARAAETGDQRSRELKSLIAERDKRMKTLEKLEPRASQAATAVKELTALDELAEAHDELETARADLASIGHDPESASRDETRLEELEAEREVLSPAMSGLNKEIEQLEARLEALAEVERTGTFQDRKQERDAAAAAERRLDRELSRLTRQIEEDTQHIAAVRSGGPDTPCPVCKKPYGDGYEQILSTYQADIATAETQLPKLEAEHAAAQQAHEHADESAAHARDAERTLSNVKGPDTPSACKQEIASHQETRTSKQRRLKEIEQELATLRVRVRNARAVAATWTSAQATVKERERRFEKAAKTAGQERYDATAHARARQRSQYLAAILVEAEELRGAVAESRGLDKELVQVLDETTRQRSSATERRSGLKALGLKVGELARLQSARDKAEERHDALRDDLHEAKMKAQAHSHEVTDYRRRLKAVRDALDEVQRRRIDLREYQVVADLLEHYRQHESERAWPQLQQGASALLAAATDGRYADIRLSADYKLTIVDRGEEHGLARYSGGEQDLANLCLRLAIAEWVARERGTDISLVILDEVFGSQDEERRRLLLNQLRSLSTRFRQMLIITHLPDIADLCDARIEVSVDDTGKSTALVAA